jgi:hypothetical protein
MIKVINNKKILNNNKIIMKNIFLLDKIKKFNFKKINKIP